MVSIRAADHILDESEGHLVEGCPDPINTGGMAATVVCNPNFLYLCYVRWVHFCNHGSKHF